MKSSFYLVVITLLCSLLLFTQEIQTVFADATITIITPTGSGLSSTSDCLDITGSNGIVWQQCNSFLYAINYDTNAIIANISSGNVFSIEACIGSTCVLGHDGTANVINKYTLAGGVITQTGQVTVGCDSNAPVFHYDALGFLWTVCGIGDKIARINPATMQVQMLSQALSASCVNPLRIAYSTDDNIGVVYCSSGTNMITFSITNPTTVAILDNEASGEGATELVIDGGNNRIMAQTTITRQIWGYSSGGILTMQSSEGTANIGACKQEALQNTDGQGIQFVCLQDDTSNAITTGFISNATGIFQIFSGFSVFTNANINGMGIDFRTNAVSAPLTPIYYINGNPDNQKWVRITDLRSIENPNPEPPSGGGGGGGGGGTGGVDCTLAENAQKLICRLADNPSDCTGALGCGGDFLIGNTTGDIGITPIICNTGIIDCVTNPDMKTNGTGYLITIVAIAIVVGIFWVASRGDLGAIPMFIWFIAVLGIVGFSTVANIIDATFLILAVVAMIALATVKLRGLFGGEFK